MGSIGDKMAMSDAIRGVHRGPATVPWLPNRFPRQGTGPLHYRPQTVYRARTPL